MYCCRWELVFLFEVAEGTVETGSLKVFTGLTYDQCEVRAYKAQVDEALSENPFFECCAAILGLAYSRCGFFCSKGCVIVPNCQPRSLNL